MSLDVIVEHPILGVGEILEIHLSTESPIVSVLWGDGSVSDYPADELEFLPINFENSSNKLSGSTYNKVSGTYPDPITSHDHYSFRLALFVEDLI